MAENTDILIRRIKDMLVYFTATEIRQVLDIYGHDRAKDKRGRP